MLSSPFYSTMLLFSLFLTFKPSHPFQEHLCNPSGYIYVWHSEIRVWGKWMISKWLIFPLKMISLFLSPFYHPVEIVCHKSLRSLSLTVYVPTTNTNHMCYPMNVQWQGWSTEKKWRSTYCELQPQKPRLYIYKINLWFLNCIPVSTYVKYSQVQTKPNWDTNLWQSIWEM